MFAPNEYSWKVIFFVLQTICHLVILGHLLLYLKEILDSQTNEI